LSKPALPLAGITVVALEQVIAAPFATRQLAELGARVIKIERPGVGDASRGYDTTVKGLSSHFVWVNRSKESVTLDAKHPEAKKILAKLVSRADVFVQNLAPGAAARLGLGAEELRAKDPRLVWCGISGYGENGPYSAKRAYDLLVQCETGLLSVTGTPEQPSKAGIPIADIAAGMYAFSGILAALLRRKDTNEGATLDISMFESLGEWLGFPAYFTNYGGSAPPRTGAFHATIVPYGPFKAGDGKTVFLGIQNEREFARFCEQVLDQPDLPKDPRYASGSLRNDHRAEMNTLIESVFAGMTAAQVVGKLEAAGIANARLNTMQEFWDHPQLEARNRWREVGSPAGPLDAMMPPLNIAGMEPDIGAVPGVGQHTHDVLAELGYAPADIEALAKEGAV
jgi:crotonobetainyl-CoA:carnitine CoA-transferase CaiB-like acyl-CoA transferase